MKNRIALISVVGAALLGFLADGKPAEAQGTGCTISPARGSWYIYADRNSIWHFGDMKVRVTSVTKLVCDSCTTYTARIVVDIKTPDYSKNQLDFGPNYSFRFNACGSEVTFTNNNLGDTLTVSVF